MSNFLQWLLGGTVSASLVTALLLAAAPALRKRYAARTLYVAWLVALCMFLNPFRIALWQPALPVALPSSAPAATEATVPTSLPASSPVTAARSVTLSASQSAAVAPRSTPVAAIAEPSPTPARPLPWAQALALLWGMGAALTLGFQLNRHLSFMRHVRRWRKPVTDPASIAPLDAERARLGIRREVPVYRCALVRSPMLAGFRRPFLLLPEQAFTGEELALVYRHELTHLRRGDLWTRAALLLATAAHWFNPMVYLMGRALGEQCEQRCDEAVLRGAPMRERVRYGETILAVLRATPKPDTLFCTHFSGGRHSLKRRLGAILSAGRKRLGAWIVLAVLAVALAAGTAFATGEASVYLASASGGSVRVLPVPSMQRWDNPLGFYYNGVEARVVSKETVDGTEWVKVMLGSMAEPYAYYYGYVLAADLTNARPDAALPTGLVSAGDGSGRAALTSENERGTLATLPDGTQVTLLGRLMDNYHVRQGDRYGLVSVLDLTFDAETETFLAAQLPDGYVDIALAESRARMAFESEVDGYWAEYGSDPVQWPEAVRVGYTQKQLQLGYSVSALYVSPEADDLPEEQAVDLAWEAFLSNTSQGEEIKPEYDVYAALISERAGEQRRIWKVQFQHKELYGLYYEAEIISPGGELGDVTDLVAYESQKADAVAQGNLDAIRASWEAEYGPLHTWSLERKVEWQQRYEYDPSIEGTYGVPGEGEIGPDEALRLAREAMMAKYGFTEAQMDALVPDIYFTLNSTYYQEVANRYEISFCEPTELPDGSTELNYTYTVYLYSRHGVVEDIIGPDNSNG